LQWGSVAGVRTPEVSSHDRLLDVALSLFARRGYAATSTAEIQQACGMSPSSGALYRHFRSKGDVLRAALRRGLDRMRTSPAWHQATTPAERLDALLRTAAATQTTIEENADLVRLMLHEPDAAPDMVDELWVRNLAYAYGIMGRAMRASAEEAGSQIDDPEAISAVLLAALSYLPVMQIMIGRTPGGIDPARFQEAWLRLSHSVFTRGVS
jgi:AcrR family transcriptional regulator